MAISCSPRLVTVEPVLFLYMLGFWLMYTAHQALVYQKICESVFSNDTKICENLKNASYITEENVVQEAASQWGKYFAITISLPAVISSLFIGSWGDRVSRKLALIVPCCGALIASLAYTVFTIHNGPFPIPLLFIPLVAMGVTGGVIICLMGCFSYLSAITEETNRTVRLGILSAMVPLAGVLSNTLGGLFLDKTNYTTVFITTMAIFLTATTYIIFWLKDIRPEPDLHSGPVYVRLLSCEHIKSTFISLFTKRSRNHRVHIWIVLISGFVSLTESIGVFGIVFIFLKKQPLSWGQTEYGIWLGVQQGLHGITLLSILPLLKNKMRLHDTSIILVGVVSSLTSTLILGFSTVTWMVYLANIAGMFHQFAVSGMRSLISTFVETNEQGKLFAAFSSIESLAGLVGGLIVSLVYQHTVAHYPWLTFVLAACLDILPIILIVWLKFDLRQHPGYTVFESDSQQDLTQVDENEEAALSEEREGLVSNTQSARTFPTAQPSTC